VRRPAAQELLEAYAVRSALETLAARLAVPHLTEVALERLSAAVEAMQAAARSGDRPRLAEADASFHGTIVELAANATLEKVWRSLEPFLRTYITLVMPGADPQWSADLHPPVLAALRARDAEAVVAAIDQHFHDVSDNMASRLAEEANR
jgi:DNA-binding GntR family transcriptional regulator